MTTNRRTNSKSLPTPSSSASRVASTPSPDHETDVDIIEVHLPAITTVYPVVPFEHTIGSHANTAAAAHLLTDHIQSLSVSSRRQLGIILKKWCTFLDMVGIQRTPDDLRADPAAWGFVSWGLVQAYLKLLLKEGYATTTINLHLAMIRALIYIAHQAGGIRDESEIQRIRTIRGYGSRRSKNVNAQRESDNIPTRIGTKKAEWVALSPEEAYLLKHGHQDTPQGRRDSLLMCLLLDHGLRVSEVAGLKVQDFDLKNGLLHFYRPKVDKEQVHRFSGDTLGAVRVYFGAGDAPVQGPVLRASKKNGELGKAGMTTRRITERVCALGKQVLGIPNLRAHDCRHYWATVAIRNGTDIKALQTAGGWNSPAMPLRYAEENTIANEGVVLSKDSTK
jgi:integrase